MKIKVILSLLVLAFLLVILLIKWNLVNDIDSTIGEHIYHLHDHPVSTIISGIGVIGSTVGIISTLFLFMFILAWLEKLCFRGCVIFQDRKSVV